MADDAMSHVRGLHEARAGARHVPGVRLQRVIGRGPRAEAIGPVEGAMLRRIAEE